MKMHLSKAESVLLLALAALLAVALAGPALPQPAHQHDFADRRLLWGVPYAMDVLSNLPFALMALAGGWTLWRARGAVGDVQRAMAALFFAGLALTALGSAWYHLAPADAGLAVDRYAMSVAFAGLLALAAAGGVSERAGVLLGAVLLVLAPASVAAWAATGNLLPWVLVQFGGMVAVLVFACVRPRPGALAVNWFLVLLAYAAAKVLEMGDHLVYEMTGQLVSGHTLKHVVAAFAAVPVIAALGACAAQGQDARARFARREMA